jgi:hypothetical protein
MYHHSNLNLNLNFNLKLNSRRITHHYLSRTNLNRLIFLDLQLWAITVIWHLLLPLVRSQFRLRLRLGGERWRNTTTVICMTPWHKRIEKSDQDQALGWSWCGSHLVQARLMIIRVISNVIVLPKDSSTCALQTHFTFLCLCSYSCVYPIWSDDACTYWYFPRLELNTTVYLSSNTRIKTSSWDGIG